MFFKRFFLLIRLMKNGGEECMIILYASCIIRGTKKFSDVPATLKEQVRQILADEGLDNLTHD